MLVHIGQTNLLNPGKLVIFDARSFINATANKVNKGGFEDC